MRIYRGGRTNKTEQVELLEHTELREHTEWVTTNGTNGMG